MAAQEHEQLSILQDDGGHTVYAVPLSVAEAHRATPAQYAEFEAAMRDTKGFNMPADATLHLLTAEQLAPYRLSDEGRDALLSQLAGGSDTNDVQGLQYIGQFPALVWVRPANTLGASFVAAWFGGYLLPTSPAGARDPNQNRDANYYPPLH